MGDYGLDRGMVRIGGSFGIGEHQPRIEDGEALVLHRPHVEVVDRDDRVDVEVAFQPVDVLVPFHRLHERRHGMSAAPGIVRPDVDAQRDLAARPCREAVGEALERPRDQGEEIGRLGKRIDPCSEVPAIAGLSGGARIAVREQHRRQLPVGDDGNGVTRHHVGPIEEVGDATEAFGLAMSAKQIAGDVEAGQLRVGRRVCPRRDVEHEAVRHVPDRERLRADLVAGRPAVELDR